MADYIIDGEGEVWVVGSREFQRRFGYPHPDFDLADYAVRNFGCVRLRNHGAALRLHLAPETISERTFGSTVRMMVNHPRDRYAFEIGALGSCVEIVSNLNDSIARLEDFRGGIEWRCGTIVVSEELSLGRLRHPKRGRLRELIKEWKRLRGHLSRDVLAPFELSDVAGRTVLARMQGQGRTRIEHFGARLDVYGTGWHERAIGLDLEEQPDPAYAAGTAKGYREVAATERPRLELVDALIRAPGRHPQRSRYERLLLPWRSSDGATFVSGASVLRTRFAAGIDR